MKFIDIGGKMITRRSSPYLVAEASLNHNGNIGMAMEMICIAKKAGVDAIKFQTFRAKEFCNADSELYETFANCEFNFTEWQIIKKVCDQEGITFFSTPQNYSDLKILLKLGIPAIKVGSDDLINLPLIHKFAQTKLPIILSSGMAYAIEIDMAINTLKNVDRRYPVILMHCISLYPTEPKEVNIRKIIRLMRKYPRILLGFSDHTIGYTAAVLAVGCGAKVFETHFTLDKTLPGPDHEFSKDPGELSAWVSAIKEAHQMLGSSILKPTERETEMRTKARRSITTIRDIKKGEIFTEDNIGLMRPEIGLSPAHINIFLGSMAIRDIKMGEKLYRGDINGI